MFDRMLEPPRCTRLGCRHDEARKLDARIAELEGEVTRLREALQDIIDPMAKLRRNAEKQGRELEGWVAVQIANDVHFARAIATTALGGQS